MMKYNILMAKRYIVDKDDKDKSVEECDDNMPIVSLLSLNTWGEWTKIINSVQRKWKLRRKANTLVIHAKTEATPSDYCIDMIYL